VRYLTSELNLTGTQVQQLTPIVADWAKKQADLRSQVDPQFRALREEFHNRVRQILNPEQMDKFTELVRRHDERRKPRN
jgi:Spy/CpxP family protein refolding chaperone